MIVIIIIIIVIVIVIIVFVADSVNVIRGQNDVGPVELVIVGDVFIFCILSLEMIKLVTILFISSFDKTKITGIQNTSDIKFRELSSTFFLIENPDSKTCSFHLDDVWGLGMGIDISLKSLQKTLIIDQTREMNYSLHH